MDTRAAARTWVDAWSRAWPAADSEPLAEVYAQDAVFRSHPFREPQRGREGVLDYARWAFADQEGFRGCSFGEPVVAGDRAVVEYWAVVVEHGGETTIAGVALLRFGADGPSATTGPRSRALGSRRTVGAASASPGALLAGGTLFA